MTRSHSTSTALVALWSLWACVLGCGSGGGAKPSTVRQMSWKDDGVLVTAASAMASLSTEGDRQYLRITGTDFSVGVSLAVATPTPLSPQPFVCGQTTAGQTVYVSYNEPDGGVLTATPTCTVDVTQVGAVGGAPAIGTFQATVTTPDGATKVLSNGSFNLPLTM